MKYFLFIVFLLAICSCTAKKTSKQDEHVKTKDSLQARSDSFNIQNLSSNPSLQNDIALDTINIDGNKNHTGITIIYPLLNEKDYSKIYRQINNLIKNKKTQFYEMTNDDRVEYDSGLGMYTGWSMWIEPKSLYQTKKIISFGIENGYGFSGMPAAFEYTVINCDIEKKKQISFQDYFRLNNLLDTVYIEKIIGRAINREFSLKKYAGLDTPVNFSFDNKYVYFYFDKYDILGWGIFSVKKQYILDHINPDYR